jgi:protein-S-isoprenylcysteine O-methyltransferase Ste14
VSGPERAPNQATAIIGTVIFLFVGPGVVAGVIPWWFSRWQVKPSLLDVGFLKAVGVALIALGLLALLDSFARFALQGFGTPAPPLPARRLVATGLYRHARNPIYLANTALILGQGLLFARPGLLAYGALLWIGFHLFVLVYEEPTLRKTFGAEYEAYAAHVPRWLPLLRPWTAPP